MSWLYLFIAGLFEVLWAIGLKIGFINFFVGSMTVIGMIASFYFLSLSIKVIPIGQAYAIWTGIGTIGTVILGIILFGDELSFAKAVCILIIILGISGLKLL